MSRSLAERDAAGEGGNLIVSVRVKRNLLRVAA
jgi:hypothetical protein